MSGKVICLILAFCLVQVYAAPKQDPQNVIDDLLNKIKELVQKAKDALQKLLDIIQSNGQAIIDKAKNLINEIIDDAKNIISKLGPCAQALLPKLDQLKDEAVNAVTKCVLAEIPAALKLVTQLKPVVEEITALVAEITAKAAGCAALGSVEEAICLGKLAIEEEPKVKQAVNDATPVVKDAIDLLQKFEGCVAPQLDKLKDEVNDIINQAQNC